MLRLFFGRLELSTGNVVIAFYSAVMMPFLTDPKIDRWFNHFNYTKFIPIPHLYVVLAFAVLLLLGSIKVSSLYIKLKFSVKLKYFSEYS